MVGRNDAKLIFERGAKRLVLRSRSSVSFRRRMDAPGACSAGWQTLPLGANPAETSKEWRLRPSFPIRRLAAKRRSSPPHCRPAFDHRNQALRPFASHSHPAFIDRAVAAIDRQQIAFPQNMATNPRAASGGVDLQLAAADDANLSQLPRDDSGVRRSRALRGHETRDLGQGLEIGGFRKFAKQDHRSASGSDLRDARRIEDGDARRHARARRRAAPDRHGVLVDDQSLGGHAVEIASSRGNAAANGEK